MSTQQDERDTPPVEAYEQEASEPAKGDPKADLKKKWAAKEMNMDSEFNFGKHRGMLLVSIIESHPGYITWIIANDVATFDDEVLDLLVEKGIV
jgi:hypothetical protein